MPLPQLSLAIVGVRFANKSGPTRLFEIAALKPGERIELRPEPKNPADPYAVAVYSPRGIQLGYLAAERAPRIGALIRQGREVAAIFQEQTEWGGAIRVAFDGDLPVLPRPKPKPAQEQDFWPDEEWPD